MEGAPIMESFRQCCLKVSRAPELSVDEMMIPFQGKMPSRQHLPLKPNPFGMKVFVLANPNDVILDFHAYTGEGTFRHLAQQVTDMGIGASAVITLLNNVPAGSSLYFDRYFTSEALLDYLLEHNISGTGTVIKNRLPRGITFKEDSAIKKEGRGTFQIFERDNQKMCATKWLDNKPVFLLSTAHAAMPVDTVKRWSKKDRDHVDVCRPSVVRLYNHCMGGVDLADRMVSLYRMKARANKWPVRVVMHFLDCPVSNAWILYKEAAKECGTPKKDLLDFMKFRLRIGKMFVRNPSQPEEDAVSEGESEASPTSVQRRRRVVPHSLPELRKSEAVHLPEIVQSSQSNRCRQRGCKSYTRIRCVACKVFLCVAGNRNCFLMYHK